MASRSLSALLLLLPALPLAAAGDNWSFGSYAKLDFTNGSPPMFTFSYGTVV